MQNTPEVIAGYEAIRGTAALVPIQHDLLIEVLGDDRIDWLQGQVTADLRDLDEEQPLPYCMTTPTGQLIADGMIWSALPLDSGLGDGASGNTARLILSIPATAKDAVLQRFADMVILEDVAVQVLQGRLVTVQGPETERIWAGLIGEITSSVTQCTHTPAIGLRHDRTGSGGMDVLAVDDVCVDMLHEWFPPAPAEALNIARLEAGVPIIGIDTGPKTLPPELGLHYERTHISYEKGCYTGQEVLMRIHSRGHTNRTWVGLIAEEPIQSGAPVTAEGKEIGSVTSAAVSPHLGPIAAAMLRNEFANPRARVQVEENSAAVHPMPLLKG